LSRPVSVVEALRRAADDPATARTALATHKIRIFIRLTDGLGSRGRTWIGLGLGAASRLWSGTGRRGTAAWLTLEVLAIDRTTERRAAVAMATKVGLDTSSRRLANRAARLCLELGDASAAQRIVTAARLADGAGTGLLLAAEVDWQLGRYGRARDRAERRLAARPGDRDARRVRDWAIAELTAMDPAWRPRLGRTGARPVPTRGRILHLLTNSLPYRQAGYTIRSQNIARCQVEVGLDPQMATRAGFPRSDGVRDAGDREVLDGIVYWRLDPDLAPGAGSLVVAERTAAAAAELVERVRPALLQPTTNHLNAQVALALRERYGLPVVYEVRGFLEETWRSRVGGDGADADRYVATRAVETAAMREADAVVTLSETMRADIVGRGGVDPERVVVVPNAVDVTRFMPGPRDPTLAARLGIGDEPVIGYISSFTAYEGIRFLIEATAELRRRGRRVRCLLVGDGEERAELETMARLAGLDHGEVIFTGRVPYEAIQDYYRLIDVFVVPRTNDRVSQLVTPLKPYEAMAMARPLVVSGVAALLEITSGGSTGRAFTPEDPLSLASVLEPLLEDADERAELGAAARAWVVANRTWRHNGERYRELYQRLGAA